jgi:hypothetical protein
MRRFNCEAGHGYGIANSVEFLNKISQTEEVSEETSRALQDAAYLLDENHLYIKSDVCDEVEMTYIEYEYLKLIKYLQESPAEE